LLILCASFLEHFDFAYMSNSKKELKKAKHFYFNVWRGNEGPCPAFNGEIIQITRAGWNHLLFSPKRDSAEMFRRLDLLPCARRIIESAREVKEYRRDGEVEYWSLERIVKGRKIRVIIRSVKGGPKQFFSVFIKKQIKQK